MHYKWCTYFNYVFLNYCFSGQERTFSDDSVLSKFNTQYQWTHLNYTWTSSNHYQWALKSGTYIPENNAPVGIKFYKNTLFLSVPRFRKGIPTTMVYLETDRWTKSNNPLLSPFPNWAINEDATSCGNIQSVQSMEVDTKGIMWALDGVRINNYIGCPAKLMLFDLADAGKLVHVHVFSNEISLQDGGFLNDIVVDESDGAFAYITDNSAIDPGIIVYSKWKDRSWKLRDASMFPEPKANNFPVEQIKFSNAVPIDGIALSPPSKTGNRTIYFCALTGFSLYSIPTNTIKNELLVKSGQWRQSIALIGQKISQSDGIVIDNQSNMYQTLLPLYGVAKWNINRPIWTSKVIDQNRKTLIWPDGFAFDQKGFLFLISNQVFKFIDPTSKPRITGDVQFRILKLFTGSKSYLYG